MELSFIVISGDVKKCSYSLELATQSFPQTGYYEIIVNLGNEKFIFKGMNLKQLKLDIYNKLRSENTLIKPPEDLPLLPEDFFRL